jgi:hypothetical protein
MGDEIVDEVVVLVCENIRASRPPPPHFPLHLGVIPVLQPKLKSV